MSTQTTSEYMLLFGGTDWHEGLSPEVRGIFDSDMGWKGGLLDAFAARVVEGGSI